MQALEKSIEGGVMKWAKSNKIKSKIKSAGELLDRWFILPGGHLFIIEFKRPGKGKLSKRQINEIKELRSLGYDVEVHDDKKEAIESIKLRLEATRLSKESNKILSTEPIRRSILRSRVREDKYNPSRDKDSKK